MTAEVQNVGLTELIEHLTQNQVENYCRLRLDPPDLLSLSDHLGECEACRRRIEAAMNGDTAFFALRSEAFGEAAEVFSPHATRPHLTAEQTAGFVDGNLVGEELQMVADHLTSCEHCALTVGDLRAFSKQIGPTLDREYHPASPQASTEGWWKRTLDSLLAPFRGSPGLAVASALTVVLLTLTGFFMWRALRGTEPQQQIVVSPPPPTPPSQPAPAPPVVQIVAQLNDGAGQLALDQDGKLLGADDLPPAYQSLLKEALTKPRIEASPRLRGLTRPPSSLMSTDKQGSEFTVAEPVGKVLMTDRPTFRWSQMGGATGYVVEVYDESFNLVATSSQLTANSWRAPERLGRGRVYSWQVKAIKDGQEFTSPRPPAPQAKFRILDQAKANELAKARRAYGSSHLTLGLLYAQAGLLAEAEQELRKLQKANPDSEIARALLSQVQALRRRE
jgi:hypothetical protein